MKNITIKKKSKSTAKAAIKKKYYIKTKMETSINNFMKRKDTLYKSFVIKKVLTTEQVCGILSSLPNVPWEKMGKHDGVLWKDSTDVDFENFVAEMMISKYEGNSFKKFLEAIGKAMGIQKPLISNLKPIKHESYVKVFPLIISNSKSNKLTA